MSRLPTLEVDTLTAAQKTLYEAVSRTRKTGLGGPFSVWVRTPDVGTPANLLHNAFRLHGKLERRLFEMLILLVSHQAHANYVWTFHVDKALEAGLSPAIIEAIAAHRMPDFAADDDRLVYDLVDALIRTKTLSDALFARGQAALGADVLIEVVSAVGFYTMVSMLVNAFDVPPAQRQHERRPLDLSLSALYAGECPINAASVRLSPA